MRIIVVTVGIEADLHWKELVSDPFEKNFYNLDNAFHIIFLLQSPELAQCANHGELIPFEIIRDCVCSLLRNNDHDLFVCQAFNCLNRWLTSGKFERSENIKLGL